ncbi:uncharacterized protein MELLADRAFT_96186 [Melampsora larici-populina 98AG31]|uniref:Uncharacterized protein n=1 Tax=Melampsora larici-populina (strain 98AG31 / pathotype 3-4-7) TaxID=747676 RepID=F4SBA0_MELLP|nr:uncharacterized protein MELLADRAFT_96186 [Melampsora larici-populina 98AG31]EGF98078.1 hypothetical protein MELLADRAFT_96186 [Melampsora larici-populina 98AG31]
MLGGSIAHDWRCDQLNHERALINAGASRPIISTADDWGPPPPRGAPAGAPHPFLGRIEQQFTPIKSNQVASQVGPQRAKVVYPCQRASRGPVARGHRTNGNKGCPHQYCQAGGVPSTPVEQRPGAQPNAGAIVNPVLPSTATAAHLPTPGSSAPQAAPARRPAPHVHQWAQAANTLGHRLDFQAISAIQIDRRERYKAQERAIANKFDERKVVTIYLWLDAVEPKVISAHMDQWPKARLDESLLLMQACTKHFGPTWNRALLFWDDKIDTWHETMVTIPHRYSVNKQEIVVRSPQVDPRTPGLPLSKSKALQPKLQDPRADPPVASSSVSVDASPFDSDPDVIVVNGPKNTTHALHSQQTKQLDKLNAKQKGLTNATDDENDEVFVQNPPTPNAQPQRREDFDDELPDLDLFIKTSTAKAQAINTSSDPKVSSDPKFSPPGKSPTPSPVLTATTNGNNSTQVQTNTNKVESSTNTHIKKRGWPSSFVLVSDLLAWYKNCETCSPQQAWMKAFGSEWRLGTSTMYRYIQWIDEVDYKIFLNEYIKFPRANVGEARIRFKEEFKRVAHI